MFSRRTNARSIAVGMVVGVVLSIVLYLQGPSTIGGINSGVLSTGINSLIIIVWRLVAPGPDREPIARKIRRKTPARNTSAPEASVAWSGSTN